MKDISWKEYEEAARHLLDSIKDNLNLSQIEPKQNRLGQETETEWEIDLIAYDAGTENTVLVECKRWAKRRIPQEIIAGLVYRIQDTGADRGIIITPLGLQEGAKKVAKANKITEVILDSNATPESYVAQIANLIIAKITLKATATLQAEPIIEHAADAKT